MKLQIYFILFFSFAELISAEEIQCTDSSEHNVSLRDSGGSLSQMDIQDQGSIGSCYANSLSTVLYPQIGYEASPNYLALLSHQNDKGRDITDGGDSCDLFNNINNDYLCSSSNVPLDRMTSDGIDIVLDNLGAFFDDFNNGSSLRDYQEIFDSLVTFEKEAKINSEDICSQIQNYPFVNIEDPIVSGSSLGFAYYMPASIDYKESKGEVVDEVTDELFPLNPKTKKRELSSKLIKIYDKLWQEIVGLNEIDDDDEKFKKYKDLTRKLFSDLNLGHNTMAFELFDFIYLNFNADYPENEDFLLTFESDLSATNYDMCVNDKTMLYFQENFIRGAVNDVNSDQIECNDSNLVSTYLGMIDGLKIIMETEEGLLSAIEEMRGYLKKDDPTLKDFISSYITDGACANEKAISAQKKLKGMECVNIALIRKKNKDKSIEENKKILKQRLNRFAHRKLKKGEALIVDFCTSFFDDPNANINLDEENCDKLGEEHGLHSMSLIGQRCNNGIMEYQIQNSWGKGCDYLRPKDANGDITEKPPIYDCDDSIGAFWINESVFVNNVIDIGYLRPKKK